MAKERPVRRIIGRAVLPVLLIAVGIASVIYGARHRAVPVVSRQLDVQVVEEEQEVTIPVPTPFAPVPPDGQPATDAGQPLPGPPGMELFPPPPPMKVKRIAYVVKKRVKEVTDDEPEPLLIQEVTVGGVALGDSGALWRTYGPTEDGQQAARPSLCPS